MNWWMVYFLVWITAALASVGLTWVARAAGRRIGFVDRPHREEHKQHGEAVSMLGGVGIFAAWLFTVFAGYFLAPLFAGWVSPGVGAYLDSLHVALPRLLCIMGAGAGLLILGLVDDWRPLGAGSKLAAQLLLAAVAATCGLRITLFAHYPLLAWAATVVWILLVVNAVNFFDNMDGLAAGTAAISAFIFLVVAVVGEQYFVAVLAAVTCGAASGFLVFNRPPATIFMGDAGSHFLGYMLAAIGTMVTFYTPAASPTPAPLLIPLLALALPIFDAFAVVTIRLRYRRPIYLGDQRHISHRFVQMGLRKGPAVLVIHLLSFAIGTGALALLWLPPFGTVIVLGQALALLALTSILHATKLRHA
jgi:UDP-GlcNAc:undecaprenyl-phosphate GlcNAc-1-phosphate transferase